MLLLKPLTLHATLLATLMTAGIAQTVPSAPRVRVKVDITLPKHEFALDEPVRFRAVLSNQGSAAVYVAKSWAWTGGGIAGFSVDVKQLSGPRPQKGCSVVGDHGICDEPRSAQQILHEDFVLLLPGQLIGFDGLLPGCTDGGDRTPGVFQINAAYLPADWNTEKVASLGDDEKVVLTEPIRSKPTIFRVLAAGKPAASAEQQSRKLR